MYDFSWNSENFMSCNILNQNPYKYLHKSAREKENAISHVHENLKKSKQISTNTHEISWHLFQKCALSFDFSGSVHLHHFVFILAFRISKYSNVWSILSSGRNVSYAFFSIQTPVLYPSCSLVFAIFWHEMKTMKLNQLLFSPYMFELFCFHSLPRSTDSKKIRKYTQSAHFHLFLMTWQSKQCVCTMQKIRFFFSNLVLVIQEHILFESKHSKLQHCYLCISLAGNSSNIRCFHIFIEYVPKGKIELAQKNARKIFWQCSLFDFEF